MTISKTVLNHFNVILCKHLIYLNITKLVKIGTSVFKYISTLSNTIIL